MDRFLDQLKFSCVSPSRSMYSLQQRAFLSFSLLITELKDWHKEVASSVNKQSLEGFDLFPFWLFFVGIFLSLSVIEISLTSTSGISENFAFPTRSLTSRKNNFNSSNDLSKLSYCLRDFRNHFEMEILFLSSQKRSSAFRPNQRNHDNLSSVTKLKRKSQLKKNRQLK